MSENNLPVLDLSQENDIHQIFPQLPRLSSDRAIWTGITLEHHRQPPFETPEYSIG